MSVSRANSGGGTVARGPTCSIFATLKRRDTSPGWEMKLLRRRTKASHAKMRFMEREITLRRLGSLDEMKADSYSYWRRQPAFARLAAVTELNSDLAALKGTRGDAPRLQRVVRLLKR